jgi:hypothetical protein
LILRLEQPDDYDLAKLTANSVKLEQLSLHSAFHVAGLYLLLAAPAAAPETLVVCPDEFRAALDPWEKHRREQGHELLIVPPAHGPEKLKATIGRISQSGRLKYLVLIGDVPGGPGHTPAGHRYTVPTNYVAATVNTRWRSEPKIATDAPYADVNSDGLPDLAVGRIPADNADELAAVVRKILRYELLPSSPADRHLNVVAGVGGFGTVADALIEAAARQVILQTVPKGYDVQQTSASPTSPHCPPAGDFRPCVCRQLAAGGLAWIYLGHGLSAELDSVPASAGMEPILSVEDVPRLHCGSPSPLAVLIACYTGAFDAEDDCLAEELVLAEHGPIAAIAATRVTMPYGNTVLGYELLRACFNDRPADLGSVLRLAQCRTLQNPSADSLRPSLDMLAVGLSPPPVDLGSERREHVSMYHLFGDPLLRLRVPPHKGPQTAAATGTIVK